MSARGSLGWGMVASNEGDPEREAQNVLEAKKRKMMLIGGSVITGLTLLLVAGVVVFSTQGASHDSSPKKKAAPAIRKKPPSPAPTPAPTPAPSTTPPPRPHIGDEMCLELEGCNHTYPMPYAFGEWPEDYKYSGSFPSGFVWGMGTASYQVEGSYREDGRGASIWDTFTGADTVGMPGANCSHCCRHAPCPINPAMAAKGATGNVACDHYRMVDTDIALMKAMGLKHYRFSIAWPRIFPTGRSSRGVNKKGLHFYNRLIDKLLAAGITPYVTLYHWDLPQGLFDPPVKSAWWARDNESVPVAEIQEEFLTYAETCFREFGDRVKFWFTFNEPWTFTMLASGWGKAPCHPLLSNVSIDPLIAGHNVLNAHAAAVELYRRKFQKAQGGKIGITLNSDWHEPNSTDPKDVAAAARGMDFQLGWYADPIFGGHGDYPPAMRRFYGERLPNFTAAQKRLINGSADFFALNHYGTGWSSYQEKPGADTTYAQVTEQGLVHGQSDWLYGAGWGLRKILNWVSKRYGQPPIYLTEGGWSIAANTAAEGAADLGRVLYYANYTAAMREAIYEDDVDVRGYFAWSLMDNFEWNEGYAERFGTVYNDYAPGQDTQGPAGWSWGQPTSGRQVRTRKNSSCWLEAVWTKNALVDPAAGFEGCVTSDVFRTSFVDPKHPHCRRFLTVDSNGLSGHILGADGAHGGKCNGKDDRVWGPCPVTLSGGTIVADFSAKGGPPNLAGFWNRTTHTIQWADGSSWQTLKEAIAAGTLIS